MFALLHLLYSLPGTGRFGEDGSRNERGSAITVGMHNAPDKREQLPMNTEVRRKTTYPTVYPTVLSDRQWEVAQRVIPAERSFGRPRTTDLRQVLNALCYMQATQ